MPSEEWGDLKKSKQICGMNVWLTGDPDDLIISIRFMIIDP